MSVTEKKQANEELTEQMEKALQEQSKGAMPGVVEAMKCVIHILQKEKERVQQIINIGHYNDEKILAEKQKSYVGVRRMKDSAFDEFITMTEQAMEGVKAQYMPAQQKGADERLLEYKQIENSVRSLPSDKLKSYVNDFLAGKTQLVEGQDLPSPDQVNTFTAELRRRGENELADGLYTHAYDALKIKTPWVNNPTWKDLTDKVKRLKALKGLGDAILLTDASSRTGNTENVKSYYISQELGLHEPQIPDVEQSE